MLASELWRGLGFQRDTQLQLGWVRGALGAYRHTGRRFSFVQHLQRFAAPPTLLHKWEQHQCAQLVQTLCVLHGIHQPRAEISKCWAELKERTFSFWGQAFMCKSVTWPALVWREKTKRKMNKTLLFSHVKWLEVISMFGFLPITEAFMNFQLCQENITFVHCWLPSWCELHNSLLRRRLL